MDITLYNTLTRNTETFVPLQPKTVGMYHCGPTVYDYVHVGNLRSYVFADTLRRMFEYNGYSVKQIVNITDVGHLVSDSDEGEDKMSKALRRENKPLTLEAMREVAVFYTDAFIADLAQMNIEQPTALPRATDHIAEDIELIQRLEKNGYAYVTADGVYFDTAKFPAYGKLGNISVENQKEGARVAVNAEKRNPADFALWKFDDKLGWKTPWGMGFPGWHIECSAMSRAYLGQPFDIHTGGIDHIPVHHNNEIAQSEAAYDLPLARYWMHNEFITLDGGKMAKSAGHHLTLKTLADESISPLAYRYWLLTAHYRSPASFTYEAVRAAQNGLVRLMSLIGSYEDGGSIVESYRKRFHAHINNDLNLPQAIALIWELTKDSGASEADKKATILDFDRVLGLRLADVPRASDEEIPAEIHALAEAREAARAAKNWAQADALRAEIEDRGFTVRDTPDGISIRPRSDFLSTE